MFKKSLFAIVLVVTSSLLVADDQYTNEQKNKAYFKMIRFYNALKSEPYYRQVRRSQRNLLNQSKEDKDNLRLILGHFRHNERLNNDFKNLKVAFAKAYSHHIMDIETQNGLDVRFNIEAPFYKALQLQEQLDSWLAPPMTDEYFFLGEDIKQYLESLIWDHTEAVLNPILSSIAYYNLQDAENTYIAEFKKNKNSQETLTRRNLLEARQLEFQNRFQATLNELKFTFATLFPEEISQRMDIPNSYVPFIELNEHSLFYELFNWKVLINNEDNRLTESVKAFKPYNKKIAEIINTFKALEQEVLHCNETIH